ncbi:helicase associated domain-containing protein [Streptomyces cyaneofuscatus]|uniref:helicase associated domain-containing protein n=1 Tax=Streptomyces cyaneofuscatus TaxID=66883 RepID=UPI0037B9EF3C
MWDPADAAWEENLGAARAYAVAYGTLAAPVTAKIMDRPVGQWLANARKKDGLGKDQARAQRRAAALAAIDPDWNPDWPINWQRHYAAVRGAVVPGSVLGYVDARGDGERARRGRVAGRPTGRVGAAVRRAA